jgi:hypothetical protein
MSDSIYERARTALHQACAHGHISMSVPVDKENDHDFVIDAALDAGERAEARMRELKSEKDEYLIGLVQVSEWIDEERKKHERRERGGQMFGTSHEPRVPLMVLLELERMVRPDALRYTRQCYFELTERAEKAEARVRELEDLLSQVANHASEAFSEMTGARELCLAAGDRMWALEKQIRWITREETTGSRPLVEPHQGAPGAELEHAAQTVAPAAKAAPAVVAPEDPEASVVADEPGKTNEH